MSSKRILSDRRSNRSSSKKLTRVSLEKRQGFLKEDSDSNLVVDSVMSEIVEHALSIIHERYLEAQTIKFVVHCAHEALMKFLRFYFYQHNDYIRKPVFWDSEKRISPSPADSWALNQVPLYRNISTNQELSSLSQIKLEMAAKKVDVEITSGSGLDLISEPSESLLEDIRSIIDHIVDNLPISEEESSETGCSSEYSIFTSIVQGRQHYSEFKMKPQHSKISMGTSTVFKLPRLDVPESGTSKKQSHGSEVALLEKLPPIRTDAKYKCRRSTPDAQTDKFKRSQRESKQ